MRDILEKIAKRFSGEEHSVTNLLSSSNEFFEVPERLITTALLLQVIRPAVREAVEHCINQLVKDLTSTHSRRVGMIAPDVLSEAISRQDLTNYATNLLVQRQDGKATKTSLLYTVNTISMAVLACASALENGLWDDISSLRETDHFSIQNNIRRFRSSEEMTVKGVMSKIQNGLERRKPLLLKAVQLFGQQQDRMLKSTIAVHYALRSVRFTDRQDSLGHLQKYSGGFCRIECELIAAQDMAKFVAQTPLVHPHEGQSTLFSWFTVDWGEEKNLMAKKLTQPLANQPDAAYYEAHYQHRVARLRHPHIFNLRYLYRHSVEQQEPELWMIFPPIFSTIEQSLREKPSSISVDQLLNWMIDIADALKTLHNNQLVHGNVKLSNLLLTKKGKTLLANRVDRRDSYDAGKRCHLGGTMDSMTDDIKEFSSVGKLLRQHVASKESNASVLLAFDDLMSSWEKTDAVQPVTAESVQQKLAALLTPLSTSPTVF